MESKLKMQHVKSKLNGERYAHMLNLIKFDLFFLQNPWNQERLQLKLGLSYHPYHHILQPKKQIEQ